MGASGDAVRMVTVRQLRDGALAAMGSGDDSALHKCCAGLMSRRGRLEVEVVDAVSALAMALAVSGGAACARFAQQLCDFVGSAGSPRQQLALSRKMYAAVSSSPAASSSSAASAASSELYAALALARALVSCQKHNEAIPLLQDVVRLSSDWSRCSECNQSERDQAERDEAERDEAACNCKGEWALHCMSLAMCCQKAGRFDDGRALCREAVDAFADDPRGRLLTRAKLSMALCMRNLEEHACALRVYLGMTGVPPGKDHNAAVLCRLGAGGCMLAAGDATAACAYAEQATALVRPGSALATLALDLLKDCKASCKASCKAGRSEGPRSQQDADAAMRQLLADEAEAAVKEARAAASRAIKTARRAARKVEKAMKAAAAAAAATWPHNGDGEGSFRSLT